MKKILIIIDMQNDFITGSLANPAAQAIIDPICDLVKSWPADGDIIMTRDTHFSDYLETPEGKALPVKHCIKSTTGWLVHDKIREAVAKKYCSYDLPYIDKPGFGYEYWKLESILTKEEDLEITLVGTCTSICVASNATILKNTLPNSKVIVLKDLCADINEESHNAALIVMRNQQVEVK